MSVVLDQLESLVRPLETAEYLGLPVRAEGEQHLTVCPYCKSDRLWILTDSFLCPNDNCPMVAGSVVEIASAGQGGFEGGARRLWEMFGDRLLRCTDYTPESFPTQVAAMVRSRRRLPDYLRKLQVHNATSAARAAFLSSLLRHGGHDPGSHLMVALLPEDHARFTDLLCEVSSTPVKLPAGRPLVVIPHWSRPHVLAALLIVDVKRSWQAAVEIEPYQVAVAGLPALTSATQQVYLHQTFLEALQQNSQWRVRDPSHLSLSYLLGTAGTDVPLLPSPVLQVSNTLSATAQARLHRAWPDLQLCDAGVSRLKSFKQHLLDTLKGKMRGGSLNLSGLHLLSGYNPQGDLKQWLHHQFRSAGLMGAADQLARGLYNIEICRTDKTAILETPDGYMQRRGSGVPELFSNFVVRLDANITFGEQTATHHAATILMDGETHATILPSRLLDAPRELQEHVQMLLAARKNLSVPMLRDPAAFRNVAFYLRGTLPRLPVQPGLPFLGWNHKRDTFFMPGAIIGLDMPLRGRYPLHPDVFTLDAYSAEPQDDGIAATDLPREIQTFILLILGSIIRGQRNEHLEIIQVRHDGAAKALLSGLFKGLGQTRPLAKLDRETRALRLYPAWAVANTKTTGIRLPYFLLDDHGRRVTGSYDENTLAAGAATLRSLVIRVCESLLSLAEPDNWKVPPSVLYTNRLAAYAQQFLQEHCGVVLEADLPTFEWTEKLLKQIPVTTVPDVFTYDFKEQRISCRADLFADRIDMPCLEIELRRLSEEVVVKPGHRIEIDAYSALRLLETYYGEMPQLVSTPPS